MQNAPVAEGETIAQKYQVEKVIGEGGMGVVVAARHLGLHQRVAIKFLLADMALDNSGASERFRREARAAARIRSEHVCRVLDVGTLDNGVPFMVMEYLEGCDLSSELEQHGKLPAAEAIEYVLQACEALAEAHVAGIVHRDLKPANLFLAQRPDGSRAIKVLDFGVSKSRADAGVSHLTLTKTSSLIGSPVYMSPEQLESAKDVDARADIWALGSILYELVTGRPPFGGDSIAQLVNAVLNSQPPTFAALGVSAPAGLEAIVRHALAKDRDQRYASVAELTQDLAPLAPAQAAISVDRVARVLGPGGRRTRSALPGTAQGVSPGASAIATAVDPRAMATPQPVERDSSPIAKQPAWLRWAWIAAVPAMLGIGVLLARHGGSEAAVPPNTATAPGAVAGAQDAGVREHAAAPAAVARPAVAPDAGEANAQQAPAADALPSVAAQQALPSGIDLPTTPATAPAVTATSTTGTATSSGTAPALRGGASNDTAPALRGSASTHGEAKKATRPSTPQAPAGSISDFGGRR